MVDYYKTYSKFYLALDCIIFGFDKGELKLLLIKRNISPMKGKWSLMGGFMDIGETLDDAAKRVLFQLTGLTKIYMEQLKVFSELNREPDERVISVTYYALIRSSDYNKINAEKHNASWQSVSEVPELVFDHNQMVNEALEKLKRKSRSQPIGLELLPHKFSLPQLQQLYEAIFQQKLDKRNFRKKMLSTDLFKREVASDQQIGRKGTFIYSFDKKKYNELIAKGFVLDI